jgi:hypothetical protein
MFPFDPLQRAIGGQRQSSPNDTETADQARALGHAPQRVGQPPLNPATADDPRQQVDASSLIS